MKMSFPNSNASIPRRSLFSSTQCAGRPLSDFRLRARYFCWALLFLATLAAKSSGAVHFDLTFPDVVNHTGTNWDDPTYGGEARGALQEVLDGFGTLFPQSRTVQLTIVSSMGTVYAAQASPAAASGDPARPWFIDTVVYVKIVSGNDPNGGTADGSLDYNFNLAGLGAQSGSNYDINRDGVIDMRDFILLIRSKGLTRHELIHLLGAVSFVQPGTSSQFFTRNDTLFFDSMAHPFVTASGSLSSVANITDPNAYFDAGPGRHYRIAAPGDCNHLAGIMYPAREDFNGDDVIYLTKLGYFPPGQLANISTRMIVGGGDNAMIGGFIITGTQDKRVIIRAIGPSLGALGISGVLSDPVLELYDGAGSTIAANANWRDDQEAEIIQTGIAPIDNLESAIVRTLAPGSYTAIVRGAGGGTGVGLVEVYDLNQSVDSKLANISTRGFVETADNVMIGGFIVTGSGATKTVVRAIGPSLPLPGLLADPMIDLRDSNGSAVATNDNWRSEQEADIQATTLAPVNDAEAAIVTVLAPGSYTAIVRGNNNTTGVGLVETYQLNN